MYCPIVDKNIQLFEEDISVYNNCCPYDCDCCTIYISSLIDSPDS